MAQATHVKRLEIKLVILVHTTSPTNEGKQLSKYPLWDVVSGLLVGRDCRHYFVVLECLGGFPCSHHQIFIWSPWPKPIEACRLNMIELYINGLATNKTHTAVESFPGLVLPCSYLLACCWLNYIELPVGSHWAVSHGLEMASPQSSKTKRREQLRP